MEHKRKRAVEAAKSLLIALLACCAIYLTLRTQMYANLSGDSARGWLASVLQFLDKGDGPLAPPSQPGVGQRLTVHPARLAVNNGGVGRYGVQYDTAATDAVFADVFGLLRDALGSAGAAKQVPEQVWRHALGEKTGVYFDFLGTIPLEALYGWLEEGAENTALTGDVRRLLLAEDGGGKPTLYYINEQDGMYYACETAEVTQKQLETVVGGYNTNNAVFAFECPPEEGYENFAPYVMILPQTVKPAIYHGKNPLAQPEEATLNTLLQAMRFHPQSNAIYRGSEELVVKEGADDLRIRDNGSVVFHATEPDEARYPIAAAGEKPTRAEMITAAQALATGTIGAWCGEEARIYLVEAAEQGDGTWQVDFGYSLNGIPVQLYEEGYAARFVMKDGQISEFTLQFRAYTATEEFAAVLPEVQAAAAMGALEVQGSELSLCYEDNGGDRVRAGWIAEETGKS